MKQFASWLLAAVTGSAITLLAYHYLTPARPGVILERSNVPAAVVGYTVNEKGETVPLDFTGVAEKVTKAVVHIKSTTQGRSVTRNSRDPFFDFFFGPGNPNERQQGPSVGTGSGVILNAEGYIVTNNHVVQDADVVEVTLSDNRTFKAEVIGTDKDTDLAVLRIREKGLPFLSFVDSDKAKVGEWVLAVGNPFNLNSTVTAGIISAKGRNINIINRNRDMAELQQFGNTAIESFIQTDAAINPGNSGGALVDLSGGLLGINTAIASPTGSYSGYGFAVPANIVSKVVEDLIAYGTVQRGWLGVQIQSITSEVARENDLSVNEGALVTGFAEKSSAKSAGIEQGDVIVKLDDTEIKSSTALIEYIGRKRPGDKVAVTVNRQGKTKVVTVTLKNREGEVATVKREENNSIAGLGFQLEDIDSKTLKKLEITSGVRVKSVGSGKVAKHTDMKEGFIITHVDDRPVKSVEEINKVLKAKKPGETILFAGVYENYSREYIYGLRM